MNSTDTCLQFTNIYNDFIERILSSISLVCNCLCLIAFVQIVRCNNTQDIYKYLLYKSFIDIFISVRFAFKSFFNCTNCLFETSYALKVFYLIFFIYVDYALELLTLLCEVVACFNRYRFVTKTLSIFDKFSYKLVLVSMTIYSFLFYVYLFFDRQIIPQMPFQNETIVFYLINENSLGTTSYFLGYIHSVIRNLICVTFIVILNVLTLYSVKKALDKKKQLVNNVAKSTSGKILSKSERAELRLTLMVISTNLVIVVAYGMSFIKWMKIKEVDADKCFSTSNYIVYLMSFVLNFFIYFYFNLSFKKFLICSTHARKEAKHALHTNFHGKFQSHAEN